MTGPMAVGEGAYATPGHPQAGAPDGSGALLAVTRLQLTAFRSYAEASLELDRRPVVLVGPNGAGKTNVLEALSLFSSGRGLRGARLADLTHAPALMPRADGPDAPHGGGAADRWAVALTLHGPTGEDKLGTGTAGGERRVTRVNGASASGAGVFAEYLRLAWLTPAMDRLFVEGPAERRKFLDRLVLGDTPDHGTQAAAFERAMRTRNRLLSDGPADAAWLDALEHQMAEHGCAMAAARLRFLERLRGAIDDWGADGCTGTGEPAFPFADIRLEDGFADGAAAGAGDGAEGYRARLRSGRARDGAAGRTLEGPHRADLHVVHRAKGMAARDCSTGEQKALLIGLVLANARLRALEDRRPPLLLLDEVAAHLDGARRAALFDEICRLRVQAWMTGTDAVLFEAFEDRAQIIGVENACFRPRPTP